MYPKTDVLRGAACALAASLIMAMMGVTIRIASQDLPNEMVVFFRNLFGFIWLLPWLRRQGLSHLKTEQLRIHLVRSLTGLTAMYCFFYAIAKLHLAEAMLLNFSSPLFVAPIAYFWLGEILTRPIITAILIGFCGITLILQPGSGVFTPAAFIGMFSGFFAALAMVSIRSMSATEPAIRTVFYFSSISTLVSLVPLFWVWQTPSLHSLGVMFLAGFLATQGQLLLTLSYKLAPATRVGPYSYASVVFAAGFAWFLWGEKPDNWAILGAMLVCISGVIITRNR